VYFYGRLLKVRILATELYSMANPGCVVRSQFILQQSRRLSVDNLASIYAGESFYSRPGSYLADCFRRLMRRIAREHDDFKVTLRVRRVSFSVSSVRGANICKRDEVQLLKLQNLGVTSADDGDARLHPQAAG
jgi:hypothetical protein